MEENKSKKTGNRLLWAINILLIAAVAILFFIAFSNDNKGNKENVTSEYESVRTLDNSEGLSVAHINSDTLMARYKLAILKRKELESEGRKMEKELVKKQKAFEKDASYFQEQVSKNALSEKSAQEIYAALMEEEQKLMNLRDKYNNELAQKEYEVNSMLLDTITSFINKENLKWKFDYILGYTRGSNIFYAKQSMDITNEVVEKLNQEFEKALKE